MPATALLSTWCKVEKRRRADTLMMGRTVSSITYCWLIGSIGVWLLCAWVAQQPAPPKKPKATPAHTQRAVSANHPTTPVESAKPATGKALVATDLTQTGGGQFDPETGLALDKNLMLVKSQCTACHSSKLIRQSHFDREKWVERIRWMQRTQKLWDLGESEPAVLEYLTTYYGPLPMPFDGRRLPLNTPTWHKTNR